MQCPFCDGEMQPGIIKFDGRAPLRWIPEEPQKSAFDSFMDTLGGKGTLTAGKRSMWGAGNMQADYCVACKKLIIDTKIIR